MKRRRSSVSELRGLSRLFELDELFLRVLGYLDAEDLANAQRVSKHWARLAVDPQLWKRLYLPFPPPSPSSSPAPSDDEEPDVIRHEGVDWKRMVRLGTNWANGNVLEASLPLPLPPSPISRPSEPGPAEHHLALFPSFICTASPTSPLVHVYGVGSEPKPLGIVPPPPGWSSPNRPDNVTAICADEAVQPPDGAADGRPVLPARLAIFYASGGFAIVKLRFDGRLVWTRESVWDRRTRPRRTGVQDDGDPVVLAAFHHPVLVTCTLSFHVSVYMLSQSVSLVRTLHSDVAFHPAALSLAPHGSSYRATLTYCTPVYPSSWTVSVQELAVELGHGGEVRRGECYRVRSGRSRRAVTEWPRRLDPVDAVSRAVGVGTDGRWVVLAGEDSVIHVFALPSAKGGIAHAQTLLAPSGGVSALALQSGRCVSGGADGKVLVWELDDAEPEEEDGARVGRTLGYVEVRPGGRRKVEPAPQAAEEEDEDEDEWELPNPRSLAYAARALFLATPPASLPPAQHTEGGINSVTQLAFDEEKIVGLLTSVDDGPSAVSERALPPGRTPLVPIPERDLLHTCSRSGEPAASSCVGLRISTGSAEHTNTSYHDDDPAGVHDRLCVLPEANREEGRIQAARAEDVVHYEVVLLLLRYRTLLPAPGGALGTLSDKGHAVLHADAPDACLIQAELAVLEPSPADETVVCAENAHRVFGQLDVLDHNAARDALLAAVHCNAILREGGEGTVHERLGRNGEGEDCNDERCHVERFRFLQRESHGGKSEKKHAGGGDQELRYQLGTRRRAYGSLGVLCEECRDAKTELGGKKKRQSNKRGDKGEGAEDKPGEEHQPRDGSEGCPRSDTPAELRRGQEPDAPDQERGEGRADRGPDGGIANPRRASRESVPDHGEEGKDPEYRLCVIDESAVIQRRQTQLGQLDAHDENARREHACLSAGWSRPFSLLRAASLAALMLEDVAM
ncbi:hypothetical protein A1Q2_07307 [Trichosporon asahii var. asahii CBS 8904]|uniref:F-box domain-containing protein n=1 Tax=Trichosporon asahii var. asahii (strain CBS 8904) TaxID=1220162 RepID=K1W9I0_TRIAC|nr:hypothetical protein A1Q2_07307 [Trichosporon asahii var. asahii CBS 8904]